ncbi:MAG: tetratricopeptide repeat protein [Chitinophagales bacterium]
MKTNFHKILTYCLLLIFSNLLFAATPQDQMAKANELAASGKPQEAIDLYQTLIAEGQESCVLYYNLGNLYYQQGNLGLAILQYERAKKISPKDADILHNLDIANQQVKFPINNIPTLFYVRWWQNIVHTFSPTTWGLLCLLTLWGTFCAFGLFTYRKEATIKKRSFYSGITLSILTILLLLFAYSRYQYRFQHHSAIVVAQETPLQTAPSNDSEIGTTLTEGVKVVVTDQLDEWVKVSLSDGREGWISLETLQMI